ncbi:transporter substrate-binding domain-containing protein [Anaerosinus gibii]|uniref:Transporter substrate-binding domain-containing protein n=1 Tax=Selenobaculum gibii TaxID=3054208 RepID=A0A9Y2ESI4_9FIRM|nr:transporter substrate-binding domain-containing protein [Selenobaculum gbiensis]
MSKRLLALTSEDYGIAFDKNNTELVAKVNKALAELKANGEYDKIYQNGLVKSKIHKTKRGCIVLQPLSHAYLERVFMHRCKS